MARIKYSKASLQRANRKLYGLVRRTILTKKRKYDGKILQVRTGNLSKKIKPIIKVENKRLVIDLEVMEYYKYLDLGTERIEPWFLSEEITESEYMKEIIEELTNDALSDATTSMISRINS